MSKKETKHVLGRITTLTSKYLIFDPNPDVEVLKHIYFEIGAVIGEIHQVVIRSINARDDRKAKQIMDKLLETLKEIRYEQ